MSNCRYVGIDRGICWKYRPSPAVILCGGGLCAVGGRGVLVDTTDDPQTLFLLRVCQHVTARMPADDAARLLQTDLMDYVACLDMRNLDLLLVLVVAAGGDVAAVKTEVDTLDRLLGEVKGAYADPLLCVPQRDQRVAAASCQVVA